ncbi:MAG TPA: ADP-ribosylglycohydrolase family protein [Stellaceae bacterium]|nr:ADP-ribosylglycohydrolase family protein [Stellaceae bacterium]
MLGAIAGDIIGSRFEGQAGPPRDFALFHPVCRFTDDSVCTVAVTDALLGERDFAASLRTFVRRHLRRGYGGPFLAWARADDAPPYGSWGNGAPMRVAAVGWLATSEAEALALAAAQAAVSHDHPDAIAAAQAVAPAIFLARSGLPCAALRRRLGADFGYDLSPECTLVGDGFDVSAASAAGARRRPPCARLGRRGAPRRLPRRRHRHSRRHRRGAGRGRPRPPPRRRRHGASLSDRRSAAGSRTLRSGADPLSRLRPCD